MSQGTIGKSGFQTKPSALTGIPPQKLVQMNSLQPSQLKRWVMKEAKRRGLSLSVFIRSCLTAVKDNPAFLGD